MATWVVTAAGVGAALGLVGLLWVVLGGFGTLRAGDTTRGGRGASRARLRLLGDVVVPLAVATVATVVTGWPVAFPIGGLAAWGVPRLLRGVASSSSVAILEAVATWTEMLHGTMAASAGLVQALTTTAELSPPPLRMATERLAGSIRAGITPKTALVEFADAIGDPCADRVVCSLLLASSAQAQRLGDLLDALATSTREEVAMRLRIETSRASIRSGVRTVVLFSLAFAALLAVVARSYLAPFGTAGGQIVLLGVAGLYTGAVVLMVGMARPPRPIRLLGPSADVGVGPEVPVASAW